MGLFTYLRDGWGTYNRARVYERGELATMVTPLPPFGGNQKMRVFRQFLTNGGAASDSSDMRVDGSSTNVEFWVPASATKDRYIISLSFVISDASATLNSFGTITALTNGCQLEYQDEQGTVTIHEALKSNFDFVRLCLGEPAFAGSGANNSSFRAQNVSGTSEGYIPVLYMAKQFGFQWGVRLAVGTEQKLLLRVRDNTSTVDAFNCVAYGFEREE